jgi:two-component system chemotaxis response regulator CheB
MNTAEPWVLAIGASGADGVADIRTLLRALPPSLPVIVLVVLHRPWGVTSTLRRILAKDASMPVIEAETGEKFMPGTVYIGMPEQHLTLVERSYGILVGDPDRDYGNRTVDLLFGSVARFGGKRMIGVVLSGSLDDGSRGLAAINHAGGRVMVIDRNQEEGDRETPGMPENAEKYDGPIDCKGSALDISEAIVRIVRTG